MNEEPHATFVFPPYRLDPGQRSLSRDGQPVSLTPKEFDTLLVLVGAGGRVVEKDELVSRVWPDSYVGDGSLARNISVLRKALGEEVIETLPRKGYRLAVPVTSVSAADALLASKTALGHEARPAQPLLPALPRPAPWRKERVFVGSVIAAVLLFSFVAFRFSTINTARAHRSTTEVPPIHSILIQKVAAIDPLDEGFKLYRPVEQYGHAIYNGETNGWDRWRVVTDDQNYYYRPLSAGQKDFALQRDWKLTCICALEKGAGFSDIDLAGKGPRFDIAFLQEGNKYFVALTKGISPQLEWEKKIEFPGVADVVHPHTYELRYDHLTRTASLWIDGQRMASGYRGHHQFQEDRGLLFGAVVYMDAKESRMVFRTVRFEAY
jgi:DNA-binding winged helix-turn-helix (wHTH) protein